MKITAKMVLELIAANKPPLDTLLLEELSPGASERSSRHGTPYFRGWVGVIKGAESAIAFDGDHEFEVEGVNPSYYGFWIVRRKGAGSWVVTVPGAVAREVQDGATVDITEHVTAQTPPPELARVIREGFAKLSEMMKKEAA